MKAIKSLLSVISVNSDTSEPLARKNRASLTVILSHPF